MAAVASGTSTPPLSRRDARNLPTGVSGGERIRTADFYVANVALCQAELHPQKGTHDTAWGGTLSSMTRCNRDCRAVVVRSLRDRSSTARRPSAVRRSPPVSASG